ncbi:helix-turn-helix transcriptional regulator [bacterium]|nr:helix-turn-helix transcriptional regulator [bacterium]
METIIYSKEHKRLIGRIITARREAGLSQVQAANLLGKSQSYMSKVELAQRKIDVIELKRLAQIYKKPMSYFL